MEEKYLVRTDEFWKDIEYDPRYQVSNYGRFRKKLKSSIQVLTPYKKDNTICIKIKTRIRKKCTEKSIKKIAKLFFIKNNK